MKKITTLLLSCIVGLFAVATAQTALDENQFVNTQITADGVYTVEAGKFYAFDGRIDLIYDITIQGPDDGWIKNATNPPVIVQTPASDGSRRDFFEIKAGGKLTMKNVIMSGTHNNGEVGRVFINNTGGSGYTIDNCVITDWEDFALRNQNTAADSILVTNCVFINGLRQRYSQWGGFPLRLDVAPDYLVWENNTAVNTGRLLANSGPFHNANISQMHNTYLNQIVAGEEQRANEFITANNIFYNYHFIGYRNDNHSTPDDGYNRYWTTWNYFADSKSKLDSISLYLGQNLFFRPQEIVDWYDTSSGDSLDMSLLWEHPDVDSFIIEDDNYTIGTNYAEMDPGFTTAPGNITSIVNNIHAHRNDPTGTWVDWRIESPVSYNTTGQPALSWPPAFDLSYSNAYLQTAGTDGLPLGDLNWFPAKKAEFLTDRDDIIAAIQDSMSNATAVYDPTTMDVTPMITEVPTTAIDQVLPGVFALSNYPNPFGQVTTIKFGLLQTSKVTLTVNNIFGQKVFETTENRLAVGPQTINFDASGLSSGVYIYQITATGTNGQTYVASERMVLSK